MAFKKTRAVQERAVALNSPGRRFLSCALTAATVIGLGGCGAVYPPLATVDFVELGRYTGRWYEIARYPNSFEPGCVGVTADYALREDGRINVLNTCVEGNLDGNVRLIQGVARVVDPTTNAKLAVTFFPPFEGDYWILELGANYEYAVVGDPSRTFLWILSREPTMDEDLYADILSRLPERSYDPNRLQLVPQHSDEQ
ncbi:MAG: lipocalin family protein [Phycisphaerae bacterium]